jgi:hypothetical protein
MPPISIAGADPPFDSGFNKWKVDFNIIERHHLSQ